MTTADKIWVGIASGANVGVDWSVKKVFQQDVEYTRTQLTQDQMVVTYEASAQVAMWLRSALNCEAFNWDADQREMATLALAELDIPANNAAALQAIVTKAEETGMLRAATICDVVAEKIKGKIKDFPVNWAHNCAAYIRLAAGELP
jgi:hypothetical protein